MNILIIDRSQHKPCFYCGQKKELRPYGKDGAFVCFECAMKDEVEAAKQMRKLWEVADTVIITPNKK